MESNDGYNNRYYIFKYALMLLVLYTRKLVDNIKKPKEDNNYEFYDNPQRLTANKRAVDGVYINGASENGIFFSVGLFRRQKLYCDAFMMLKISEVDSDILVLPRMPDTTLVQTMYCHDQFEVDGLRLTCITPMCQWRIQYSGVMKSYVNSEAIYAVNLDLIWSALTPEYFMFEKDMSPWCVASTSARQRWNDEYFKTIEKLQQIHFAQVGEIIGQVEVNGANFELMNIRSMKDRCICDVRDWRIYHRYAFHTIALKNGDIAHVGVVTAPIIYSNWPIGFIYRKKHNKIFPLTNIDFDMPVHGEHGKAPVDYKFKFQAGDGGKFEVEVLVLDSPEFFISKEWECRVLERFSLYKVNGMPGWGTSEWLYRNLRGRCVTLSQPFYDPRDLAEFIDADLEPILAQANRERGCKK